MKKVLKNKEKSLKLTTLAFTLIELLAVIIILAIVALIATPIILDVIEDARKSTGLSEANMIYNGIQNYCEAEKMKVEINIEYEEICTSSMTKEDVTKMVNIGNAEIIEVEYSNEIIWLKIKSNGKIYSLKKNKMEEIDLYKDTSGANIPQLLDNMVPIKYENDNWIVADESEEWYDYDDKEWANAVVLNTSKNVGEVVSESDIDLWYVWIPRYKYKLFNAENGSVNEQEIEIEFESGTASTGTVKCIDNISGTDGTTSSETCTNATNGNWYTHPSFTLGDTELTGFWVGKFEVSTTDIACNSSPSTTNCNNANHTIKIKPNVNSLRYTTVSNFFTAIQNISNTYSLNGDSHMMKNMEWGAVAYLSHSKYGINEEVYINNSSSFYTGRSGGNVGGSTNTVATQYPSSSTSSNNYYSYGYYTYDGKIVNYDGSIGEYATDRTLGTKASTTGNIYGVYDMSGGAHDYVMGNMVNSSEEFYTSKSGFNTPPNSIYYDSYTYGASPITHGRGKLGDATKETLKTFGNSSGGWYDDYTIFPNNNSDYSWFMRGGFFSAPNSGIFRFSRYDGNSYLYFSTRAVACVRE